MTGTTLLRTVALVLLLSDGRQQGLARNCSRIAYEKPGNVTISGIFDGTATEFGAEEMAAAAWTITALDRSDYLPGIEIGLTLYDACGTSEMAREAFDEAVAYDSSHARNISNIGILTSPEIEAKLASRLEQTNRTVSRLEHILDMDGVASIVAELLTNLSWTTVNRVIADSPRDLDIFSRKMSDEGICVYDEVAAADRYAVNNEVLSPVDVPDEGLVSKMTPVIVVLSKSDRISIIFRELTVEMRESQAKWILVPTDFALAPPDANFPGNVYAVLPLVEKRDRLVQFLTNREMQKDHMNHREATRSPLFARVAVGILELLKPLKRIQDEHCPSSRSPCPALVKLLEDLRDREEGLRGPDTVEITPENMANALNVLKIDPSDSEAFLYITSQVKGEERAEDAAIFQIFDAKLRKIKPVLLIVNERLFYETDGGRSRAKRASDPQRVFRLSVEDLEKMRFQSREQRTEGTPVQYEPDDLPQDDRHPCASVLSRQDGNLTRYCGMCQNFIKFHSATYQSTTDSHTQPPVTVTWSWRDQTWVAINASVASIGAICTLSVATFILFRMCKGDHLEGNPFFSFLILLSILLLYLSTMSYSVNQLGRDTSHPLICRVRFISPAVGYAILFSVLLSRSATLVAAERDGGIVNHVSGCMQSLLCFFMSCVQIALAAQVWIYYEEIFPAEDGGNCRVLHSDHNFIIFLSYSLFLLLLLSCAAPFASRSKRNYREGSFFGVATFLVAAVWSAWLTSYHLLPHEDKDAAVVFGLTGTSTAVLLSVFIPRTYLMTTAVVRDRIANNLPGLGYLTGSNVSQLNYRSNQALYDTVTVTCGSPNLHFPNGRVYTVHMSASSSDGSNNFVSDISTIADGFDYTVNRRKSFREVPAADCAGNAYESRESPDMTGKITKF